MADYQELLLQLVGDEPDQDMAPLFMEYVLNHGIKFIPRIYQKGYKNNQTLRAHVQNVMCFSYQLANLLGLDDSDKVNLLATSYVHDINKLPEFEGKSYDSIANEQNVGKLLETILTGCEHDFELSMEQIVSIMRAHSAHLHVDGDSFFAGNENNKTREIMIGIIRAADILDLSHGFHEREKKEKALQKINSLIHDHQLEWVWHYFSDNRGIFTNLIQNVIVGIFNRQGARPLLFYPEGVWYLVKKDTGINITTRDVARGLQNTIDTMSLDDPAKSLRYAKVGFKYTQNPFLMGLEADYVIDLLVSAITDRNDKTYSNKYDALCEKSGDKCFEAYRKWMKQKEKRASELNNTRQNYENLLKKNNLEHGFDEEQDQFKKLPEKDKDRIQKARKKYFDAEMESELETRFVTSPLWESVPSNLYSPDMDTLRCGDLIGSFALLLINHMGFSSEAAWRLAAEKAGLPNEQISELRFFDVQSDRGFRTASLLREKEINFITVQERYKKYVETKLNQNAFEKKSNPEIIRYIAANFRTPAKELKPDAGILRDYIESGNKQCSHCGGKGGIECEAGKLPRGIKPQLFSNRLIGGNSSKVKRNVCRICQQAFLIEKLMCDLYDNHYYLHLFADGGEHSSHAEPGIFLESLKMGIRNLQSTDCRSFLIQPNKVIKDYLKGENQTLNGQPTKKWGFIVPKFTESIGGQITIGINAPGANDSTRYLFALFHLLVITNQFNLRGILGKSSIPPLKPDEFGSLFIDHVPLSFRALIPDNDLDHHAAEALWQKFKNIYGLRNTYNGMDEKEIVKIAKALFDNTGLELFYFLKKAYGKSDRTKDFPPWAQAWPHLKPFIQEDYLMPIKKMAEIALKNHFHGKTFKETSQAKPLDLAFDAMSKHNPSESLEDLKMIILHDVTRGLERLSNTGSLGKERYNAVNEFVDTFFENIFKGRYKSDKNRLIKDQRRIRAAFIGYLYVLRNELKNEKKQL